MRASRSAASTAARPLLTAAALAVSAPVVLVSPAELLGQAAGYGPIVLQLPGSARALSLGNAYVGIREPESVFYNPAQVGGRNAATISVERYGSVSTAAALATSHVFGPMGIGIGAQLLDFDADAPAYPAAAPNGGQLTTEAPFSASSLVAAVALSMTIKGIRWGAAAKVAEDRVANVRDGVILGDVGAAKELGPVSVGVAVQNLGGSPRLAGTSAALPTRATVGFAGGGLPVGPLDFGASAALSVRRGGRVSPAAGVEWSYSPIDGIFFAARAGARLPERHAEGPLTLGAGFSFDRLTLDYAFEGYEGEGSGHRLGLRIR